MNTAWTILIPWHLSTAIINITYCTFRIANINNLNVVVYAALCYLEHFDVERYWYNFEVLSHHENIELRKNIEFRKYLSSWKILVICCGSVCFVWTIIIAADYIELAIAIEFRICNSVITTTVLRVNHRTHWPSIQWLKKLPAPPAWWRKKKGVDLSPFIYLSFNLDFTWLGLENYNRTIVKDKLSRNEL